MNKETGAVVMITVTSTSVPASIMSPKVLTSASL